MRRNAALAAIAALLVLGGCSLFGSGDDEDERAAAVERAEAAYEPVVAVRSIEIGRTRNGIVITAIGLAPAPGYAVPELRPRRDGQPGPEGYLDFDFVARAPDPALAPAANPAQGAEAGHRVRADRHVSLRNLRGVRGIRVHAAEGGMLLNF